MAIVVVAFMGETLLLTHSHLSSISFVVLSEFTIEFVYFSTKEDLSDLPHHQNHLHQLTDHHHWNRLRLGELPHHHLHHHSLTQVLALQQAFAVA